MQKYIDIMKKAAMAVVLAVAATSCVMEKDQVSSSLQSVIVQMNVSVGAMTKATESPTDAEAKINTVRIFAFQGERLAGHYYRGEQSDEPIFMDMLIPATGNLSTDFYVIANEDAMRLTSSNQISESMTKAQLATITFDAVHNMATYGMPMYSKLTQTIDASAAASQLNTAAGHQQHMILAQKVNIQLERPLAKISLYASKKEESASLVISDVTMLQGGTRQYAYLFKPSDASLIENIPSRTAGDRNLFSGSRKINSFLVDPDQKEDQSRYEAVFTDAYLPEVPFANGDPRSVILNIAYSAGEGTMANNGVLDMPAVERNVHYKLYCSFAANGRVTIDFIVADWKDADMWPGGLTFDHPTHSYLLPDASSTHHSDTPASMTYVEGDDSGAFVGYFQMAYPANESWTPTILDGIASDCRVEVWDVSGTDEITDPAMWVSGEQWYMIKVIPENPENIGGEVKLAITYQPTWSDESEFLMINGSQSDAVWPYEGNTEGFRQEPNYVVITQN
jgi:hypothetical protein